MVDMRSTVPTRRQLLAAAAAPALPALVPLLQDRDESVRTAVAGTYRTPSALATITWTVVVSPSRLAALAEGAPAPSS